MIAHYTDELMSQLHTHGRCSEFITRHVSASTARTRIHNAARRAGMRVRTYVSADHSRVWGVPIEEGMR